MSFRKHASLVVPGAALLLLAFVHCGGDSGSGNAGGAGGDDETGGSEAGRVAGSGAGKSGAAGAAAGSSGGSVAGAAGAATAGSAAGAAAGTGGSSAGAAGTAAQAGMGGMPAAGSAAGASGGAAGATASNCNALVCEDFEAETLDDTLWSASYSGSTVKLTTDMAAHGKRALHIHMNARAVEGRIRLKKTGLKPPIYGRVYLYITPDHRFMHSAMWHAANEHEWGMRWNQWQVTPAGAYTQAGTVVSKKWVCVQWEMTSEPAAMTLKADGQVQVTKSKDGAITKLDPMYFGVKMYHTLDDPMYNVGFDLYYDDLVLDSKPVPCL